MIFYHRLSYLWPKIYWVFEDQAKGFPFAARVWCWKRASVGCVGFRAGIAERGSSVGIFQGFRGPGSSARGRQRGNSWGFRGKRGALAKRVPRGS
jgi:hypothetical protein